MDSLITTFHIDWKIMLAQALNFGVVIFVLYRFALRPLKVLMDERAATIKGGLDNAEKQQELVAAQEKEYAAALAAARAEAATMMKEAKAETDAFRNDMMAKAQAEVTATVAAGKAQLVEEKERMMKEVQSEIVALVVNATEKVLGTAVTAPVDAKLVEQSIKNI